jgi:2'-5' RNA ligase
MPEPVEILRLFVALEVPPEVKARLARLQSALRQSVPRLSASWPRPEQMHLTLRFLGSVPAPEVPSLVEALRGALAGQPGVALELAGVGAFPGWLHPRVLWAGVVERSPEAGLARLQRAVQCATDGFAAPPAEAEFHPHVTVARVKRDAGSGVLERWARREAGTVFGGWTAGEVVLLRSQLEAGGSRHTRVAGFPLGDGPGR